MLLHATAAAALSAAAKQRRRRSALGLVAQCVASPPRPDPVVVEPPPLPLHVEQPLLLAYQRTPAGGVRAALRRRTSAQRERAPRRRAAVPDTGVAPPPAEAHAHARPARDAASPVASTGRVDGKKTAVRARLLGRSRLPTIPHCVRPTAAR